MQRRPDEERRDLGDRDETIEGLRRDLFTTTANRGLVYAAILGEMRKELGEERASQIFKRAIFDHGVRMARFLDPPAGLEDFRDWLLAFLPAGGAMHEPEVIRCDGDGLDVKMHRCPLKEGWRMMNLSEDEVADLCRHADAFDHGFFGSVFDYSMDLWSGQPDDSCILHFRPKRANQ
jgi:hypothetical protein